MKPFTLHTVLKHRKRLKDEARDRFQRAQNQLRNRQKLLQEKEIEYEALLALKKEKEAEGITVGDHIIIHNRLGLVEIELSEFQAQVRKQSESVVYERKNLISKSKEERVLQKLKERQNSEYRRFINKKEAAYLDEISTLNRKQQSSQ